MLDLSEDRCGVSGFRFRFRVACEFWSLWDVGTVELILGLCGSGLCRRVLGFKGFRGLGV